MSPSSLTERTTATSTQLDLGTDETDHLTGGRADENYCELAGKTR